MPNKRIEELDNATSLNANDLFVVSQDATAKKVAFDVLRELGGNAVVFTNTVPQNMSAILQAYNAGKTCIYIINGRIYSLVKVVNNDCHFVSVDIDKVYEAKITPSNNTTNPILSERSIGATLQNYVADAIVTNGTLLLSMSDGTTVPFYGGNDNYFADKFLPTQNLFNYRILQDGTINSAGAEQVNANYKRTAFISVKPNTTYCFNAKTAIYCLYDVNFTKLSYAYWTNTDGGGSFTTTDTTMWLRLSYNIPLNPDPTVLMLAEGEEMPPFAVYGFFADGLQLKPSQHLHEYHEYESGEIHFSFPVMTHVFKQGSTTAAAELDSNATATVQGVVKLPIGYRAEYKPTPLIIVCHGAGYGVSSSAWGASSDEHGNDTSAFMTMINSFVSAGYAVCDCNGFDDVFASQNWGAPRAIQAYRKLYEYVIAHFNVEHSVNVYGFSMGGLTALNFAYNNPDIVKSIALGAPVTDLWQQCWNSEYGASKNWRFATATAFGFDGIGTVSWDISSASPTEAELACWNANKYLTYGYNPMKRAVMIDNKNIMLSHTAPIKIWLGTADPAIDILTTQNFVNAVNNGGGACFLREVDNGLHNISFGANTYVTGEIVKWFNRFNSFA